MVAASIGVAVLVRLGRSQVATVAAGRPGAIAAGRSAKQLQIAGRLLSLRRYFPLCRKCPWRLLLIPTMRSSGPELPVAEPEVSVAPAFEPVTSGDCFEVPFAELNMFVVGGRACCFFSA